MKILTLPLKKEFAREIVAGKKIREYREFTDFMTSRLFDFKVENEQTIYTEDSHFTPIHYDAIKFYWYTKDYLLVECKGWQVFTLNQLKLYRPDESEGGDGQKSLYRVIADNDEFDVKNMSNSETIIIFKVGKVIENCAKL